MSSLDLTRTIALVKWAQSPQIYWSILRCVCRPKRGQRRHLGARYVVVMRPPPLKRWADVVIPGLLITILAGCSSTLGASVPAPTSTASTTPEAPRPQSGTPFTPNALAQICVDSTLTAFGQGVEFDIASARIERREVEPEWLVLVPARVNSYNGQAQCTVGGAPEDFLVEMSNASIEPLPEEQVQNLIRGENEGGTQ